MRDPRPSAFDQTTSVLRERGGCAQCGRESRCSFPIQVPFVFSSCAQNARRGWTNTGGGSTNLKFQKPNSKQAPSSKFQPERSPISGKSLGFGIWRLFEIWDLEFGILLLQ